MLRSLTKVSRRTAGWTLALVYALCVLAPSLALAFPDGGQAAPCVLDESYVPGAVHIHAAGSTHIDSSAQGAHLASGADHGLGSGTKRDRSPGKAQTKGLACCGLISAPALPAQFVQVVEPSSLASRCLPAACFRSADNAPARHYRPPIA